MKGARLLGHMVLAVSAVSAVEPSEVRIRTGPYLPVAGTALSVQTTLVETGVSVRNRKGEAIGGFAQEDFEIFDNGKPQTIAAFSELKGPRSGTVAVPPAAATPAPPKEDPPPAVSRTIAFYFDDFHSSQFALAQARKAAAKIVEAGLAPADLAGVFTDSGKNTQDFTSDRKALLAALDQVHTHPLPGPRTIGVCPDVNPYEAYAVSHHIDYPTEKRLIAEAVGCNCAGGGAGCIAQQPEFIDDLTKNAWNQFKANSAESLDSLANVVRRLATMPGTRVLAILSPGFVTGDLDRQKSGIVDAALRGHIAINAINPAGLETEKRSGMLRMTLSEFMAGAAAATGGSFIQNSNDISGGLERVVSAPEVSYLIGFVPTGKFDEKVHALKIRLKKPGSGLEVESRAQYFSTPPPPTAKQGAQQSIDRAVLSSDVLAGLTADVSAVIEKDTIRVLINLDTSDLRFVKRNGRFVQQLTFATVLENASGDSIEGKQSVMDLDVSEKTLGELRTKGIEATMRLHRPAAPGPWRVRQVIREAAENRIGAWTVSGVMQ